MNRFSILTLVAALAACKAPDRPPSPSSTPPLASPADEAHEAKPSDLDRSAEELFAATCEHGRRTHECDECRYQVGVVRLPDRLVEDGLVKTARVERRHLEKPVSLTGEVRFAERRVTHVSPRAEGIIQKVFVGPGQKVRRGEPLLEMESLSLGEAESHFREAEAALRLARKAYDRQATLRAEQITSEKEYLAARQEMEAAGIRAGAAADKLRRLGLGPEEVQSLAKEGATVTRGTLVLRAPTDGSVLEMHAVPGEAVRPDQSVFTLGDLSQLWVLADVYEGQLQDVLAHEFHGDMRATVTAKAFPGETFPATVDFVSPSMDEKTRTLKVRVGVPNPRGRLRAGMFVNVELFLPTGPETLAVPAAAVLADEGRSFVFVRHHGEYWLRRPVEPGQRSGGWVEVRKGLAGGETVATEGCFLLKSDVLRSKMGAGCAD
jgi:membrane fusion protein, heavy metal efflux system